MSQTFQPSKRKRKRSYGFLKRMRTTAGQRVVQRRRQKGRHRLAA